MRWVPATAAIAALLLVAGLAGRLNAGWGFGLLVLAGALLIAGTAAFAVFAFTRAGDSARLHCAFGLLLRLGAAAYVLGVAALSGHYVHETLAGRMEWHWILFGPLALAALVAVDVGIKRKLVDRNAPTWRRYRQYISREAIDDAALRRTFVDEVVLHRSLFRTSKVRWLRHTLIFWGFAAMFAVELLAVVVREGFPAFGWRDLWREPDSALRHAFDFAYDLTGCMILAGCLIALGWRIAVNGTPQRKYADTPATLFLLLVVASGFAVEAVRIAASAGDAAHAFAFAGRAAAALLPVAPATAAAWHTPLWVFHAVVSCMFIALVPALRLVHSCATPLGRLMNSQQRMLAAKKRGVLTGMLGRRAIASPGMPQADHRNG
jgi:hypothetical protein